jgi:hypothetical protein
MGVGRHHTYTPKLKSMTHYIRTKDNKTIVDLDERGGDDFNTVVCIQEYTIFLLNLSPIEQMEFMLDMDFLQELRGYWFEVVEPKGDISMRDCITLKFVEIIKRWDLCYITD